MTQIFSTLAGSRLYGTYTEDSDTDYKAVHLPRARDILIRPKRQMVLNTSTGRPDGRNTSEDTDTESFELQYFLKLAADMQTIPVEMMFLPGGIKNPHLAPDGYLVKFAQTPIWREIQANRYRILNRKTKSFVGYCKGQAVRYSMRGERLATYEAVCAILEANAGMVKTSMPPQSFKVADVLHGLAGIPGVRVITKRHGERELRYLDVFGRQVPETLSCDEAYNVYVKPVEQAGNRAKAARDSEGADWKALYHAMRIVDQGITLFQHGIIEFPAQNREFLMKIRAGEVEMDEILDIFDQKLEILEGIGDNSPLAAEPDKDWIDDFVAYQYEQIVRAG